MLVERSDVRCQGFWNQLKFELSEYLATRINRRMRRIKIGNYPIVSLAYAREILRDIQLGVYKTKTEQVPIFGEVVPQFIDLYAKQRMTH